MSFSVDVLSAMENTHNITYKGTSFNIISSFTVTYNTSGICDITISLNPGEVTAYTSYQLLKRSLSMTPVLQKIITVSPYISAQEAMTATLNITTALSVYCSPKPASIGYTISASYPMITTNDSTYA